ncbi:MAG: hypothetical protein VW496_00265 [Pelagibacteraceae bacterium]
MIFNRSNNPAASAYFNMDIENLPEDKPEKPSTGLLSKKTEQKNGMDVSNPLVRVGKQMQLIRRHRDEIKNGSTI